MKNKVVYYITYFVNKIVKPNQKELCKQRAYYHTGERVFDIIYKTKQGIISYCKEKQFFVSRFGITDVYVIFDKQLNIPIIIIETTRENMVNGHNFGTLENIKNNISEYLKEDFKIKVIHSNLWDEIKIKNKSYSFSEIECERFECEGCEICNKI